MDSPTCRSRQVPAPPVSTRQTLKRVRSQHSFCRPARAGRSRQRISCSRRHTPCGAGARPASPRRARLQPLDVLREPLLQCERRLPHRDAGLVDSRLRVHAREPPAFQHVAAQRRSGSRQKLGPRSTGAGDSRRTSEAEAVSLTVPWQGSDGAKKNRPGRPVQIQDLVARVRIELTTPRFSVVCSTN
jgi:hypothetical protein